ncbi:carboxylesterase/lipase family protein [Streptomyces longispororuber]|uniref:carboxylesterase/lipase family protein n=1 Tax=Streptomyces longispororuber TaxID=68230 RepID=UPI00210BAD03|nr:carboxylesterase family protein [Streptomyces longispororuber]MCQ4208220.1 carboxylesterase family protein [Streptomyces longispororuber]
MRSHRMRTLVAALVTVAAGLVPVAAARAAEPGGTLVHTATGWVRGERTAEGRQFLGIPYARPPVGELRWREPRPTERWSGVRDATGFGNRCVQTASWDPGYEDPTYTEDCLDLNVYAPDGSAGRPVMVWLHGGGLTAGAGADIVPDTFARTTGTVVVTVNYRLGALGFLASAGLDGTASDGVSGNYGLQDQQAALRWVRGNIARFGGDPARVTVAGESAGGRSVCTQLASPTARGLFRTGIIESGAYGDCAARTHREARAAGAAFARKLGCDGPDAVACLRRKPAREVLDAQAGFDWGPVVGGAFLPEQPAAAIAAGRSARVPVLNGANQDEGRLFAYGAYDGQGRPLTAAGYPKALTDAFGPAAGARALREYPVDRYPSPTHAYAAAAGDQLMACPALRLDERLARSGLPVYAYEFADRTSPPFASIREAGRTFDFGATHVNEVQYLFKHFGLATPLDAEQRVLARRMVQYWGSFVRGGEPRAQGAPAMPDGRTHPGRVLSLRTASVGGITLSTTVHTEHRCTFWDSVAS